MKKISLKLKFTFVLFIFFVFDEIQAQTVSYQTAVDIANAKIEQSGKENIFKLSSVSFVQYGENGEVIFRLFRLEPQGYIAVSGRKELPPVLAYSFESRLPQNIPLDNPLYGLLEKDITTRLAFLKQGNGSGSQVEDKGWKKMLESEKNSKLFQQWPPEGTTSTGGWLETNWTQSAPYNKFCPVDPVTGVRSYVGCPATAMAQIVNYYETVNNTLFTDDDDYYHSYAGRNFWIDDDYQEHDFLSYPQMNAWLDSITASFQNGKPLTSDEKAALSFACGVAAKQVYTSEVSGTFGVSQSYDAYLKFGFNNAVLLDENDTAVFTILKQNMMNARPAHLALVNENWTVGHNVVLDGYNTDDYYHFNFGWGGGYNGWYLLPDENMPYGLTVIEGVIANIAFPPINTGSASIPFNKENISLFPNPASGYLTVQLPVEVTGTAGYAVFNMQGIKVIEGVEHSQHFKIDLKRPHKLSRGIYFLKISTEKNDFTEKFSVK